MSRDDQLQKAVLAELHWEPSITAAHIGVTAENGIVTLSGHVHSFRQKRAAEMATGRVKGVKAVAEEIEVRLPSEFKRDDVEIAGAAVNRLFWNEGTPRDAIKIKVEKGWLTLTGEVNFHFQKETAEREVRNLIGITGVSNQITVKTYVDTAHISDDIQHALHRSWFSPEQVHVTAQDGRIKLTGTVHSWQERRTAASTAWAARGAISVENDLIVA